MIITIPQERPLGWNDVLAFRHWSQRRDEAERVHQLVGFISKQNKHTLFTSPVTITITAYFDKRPMDSDNICAKFYVDGLKSIVIADDTQKYVTSVTTVSKVDKKNPRVEIKIAEGGEQ